MDGCVVVEKLLLFISARETGWIIMEFEYLIQSTLAEVSSEEIITILKPPKKETIYLFAEASPNHTI